MDIKIYQAGDEVVVIRDGIASILRAVPIAGVEPAVAEPEEAPAPTKKKAKREKAAAAGRRPTSQDEIDAFLATDEEIGVPAAAKQYGVSDASIYNWRAALRKSPTGRAMKDERSGAEVASSGGNAGAMMRCSVECGQKNWQTRQPIGEARCPKCMTKAILA